jgi:23S rRNA (adenine2503-C2)-methyltransferase
MTVPEFTLVKSEVSLETEKYVLKFSDGLIAELVVIPMKTGLTLCVSSQVGCKMACAFCETGRMGKLRDLKADEILTQAFFAQNILKKPIKNIVFMGMGEPFDNYEELKIALNVLIDPHGFNFTPSKITVSTSGIIPRIYDFIEKYDKPGKKWKTKINDQVLDVVYSITEWENWEISKILC